MNITCRRSEFINLYDPAAILHADITCGKVAGTPTILLRPDKLLAHKDRVRDYVDDMVEDAVKEEESRYSWRERAQRFFFGRRDAFGRAAGTLPHMLARTFDKAKNDAQRHGFVMPLANLQRASIDDPFSASAAGRDRYVPLRAVIVTMPEPGMTFQDAFSMCRGFNRAGCPAIDPGWAAFQYIATCHEIGHAAGGEEAQADMVGALLTRRAFGDTPMPQMMADLRAVDVVMTGVTDLQRGKPLQIAQSNYGWEMVEALDSVSALPSYAVAAMTDADILDCVYMPCPRDVQRAELLTRLLFNHLAEPGAQRPWHIAEIAEAARFTHEQARFIGDPLLARMAGRLTLAAQRITGGNRSYRFQL